MTILQKETKKKYAGQSIVKKIARFLAGRFLRSPKFWKQFFPAWKSETLVVKTLLKADSNKSAFV